MRLQPAPSAEKLREIIAAIVPEFAGAEVRMLNDGWDCAAVEAAGAWIFKFPRHAAAEARLRRECRLLEFLAPRSPVPLPRMVLHEGACVFSQHRKLPGRALQPAEYAQLPEVRREQLAEELGTFYAFLHAIPLDAAGEAGAQAIAPWLAAEEVLRRAAGGLPEPLGRRLEITVRAYARLAPDETVFGYFDGHGWNMAFDHEAGVLRGLYDFADAGFGSRHQDLSYSNWISPDLTERLIERYQDCTARSMDRNRVMLCSSMLRCVEVAEALPHREDLPERLRAMEEWQHWPDREAP